MKTLFTVPAVALALGLAACGGGSSDDKSSGLDKAALVKQANTICAKFSADFGKVPFTEETLSDPTKAAAFFTTAVGFSERLNADLNKLEPAKELKADWDALLAALATGTQAFKDLAAAANAKDKAKGTELLAGLAQLDAGAKAAAAKVGATRCGTS